MLSHHPLLNNTKKLLRFASTNIHHCYIIYTQNRTLVNVKLKWVKDPVLDNVVSNTRNLKPTSTLVSLIASNPNLCLPIHRLSKHRGQLDLPQETKLSTFIRRFPNIFQEFYVPDSKGTPVPWYRLSCEVLKVYNDEMHCVLCECNVDIVNRLRKLLMLCKDRLLPIQTIDQLRFDLGLPFDYESSIVEKNPDVFSLVKLPDNRVGLKLLVWEDRLCVSYLELGTGNSRPSPDRALAFPVTFTRGFGLKRKCMEWLNEWQKLPYTNPYADASCLDPRTDVSEKRIVGVFHELLHLMIMKKTDRKNVSNLRKPLGLPQKFTKVFERHPGIFYISKKGDTQTVMLREAYTRDELNEKHPLGDIREKYVSLMKEGFLDRSRGVYKKEKEVREDNLMRGSYGSGYEYESEMEGNVLSEYESDE